VSNATVTDEQTRLGGVGHSSDRDAETAGRESVRAALGDRAPAVGDLVLIFPSVTYDLAALHAGAMSAAGPADVVGCTTVGAFTHEAQVPAGCVALYVSGVEASFGICHVERDDDDIAGVGRRAAETARDRAGEVHPHSVLMLMCDWLTPDHRSLARGAYEVTSALIPLVGGVAGDDLQFEATYTFGEGELLSNGLLCVWINSARPMGVGVGHGWRPFSRPVLVTRAEGNIIHELDGQPALDVYLSERGAAVNEDGRSETERFLERPIGLPNAFGGYDMRQIIGALPGGGLAMTAAVPEQTVVQVMASDGDALMEGARRAAVTVRDAMADEPRLAIVFSCCTRAMLLGDRVADEVGVLSDTLGGVPAAGFYTCGEFGRVTGSTGIHNSSVALLVL
jgi:hypothetical protein